MAAKQTTNQPPTPQTTMELAERLTRHADNIRNPAAKAMGDDMRAAARALRKWRVGIQEAIQHSHDEPTRARFAKLVEGA